MAEKNTGKEYEKFVESIYSSLTISDQSTTVERDVYMEGPDGPRQIDILIKTQIANHTLTTVLECRDYNKRLSVTHVDGFHSKMIDIKANKGVLVTTKGFSTTAKNKASRLGITLCLASNVNSVLNEIKREVPVKAIYTIIHYDIMIDYEVFIRTKINFGDIIKHMAFFDVLHDKIKNGVVKLPPEDKSIGMTRKERGVPMLLMNKEGERVAMIKDVKIKLLFNVEYFYGFLNDIPDLISMHQYDINTTTFIFKEEDYPNILPSLNKFESEESIPKNCLIDFKLYKIAYGKYNDEQPNMKIVNIKHKKN